jgi:hypothetical protein
MRWAARLAVVGLTAPLMIGMEDGMVGFAVASAGLCGLLGLAAWILRDDTSR